MRLKRSIEWVIEGIDFCADPVDCLAAIGREIGVRGKLDDCVDNKD